MGVAFSANLLTIYFFYEMLSVSTFPLVTHMQDKQARTGGRTYLGYLLFTSLCLLLPALSWCYVWLDGGNMTMDFMADVGKVGHFGETTQIVLLFLFTFGFAKAGLMPAHSWLPGAMVAPTPVSALLHAVAVVKVGVFCVYRVYADVFGPEVLAKMGGEEWAMVIASATIIISSLIALSQDNLKRRLAFSTIGQLGYIVLGAAIATDRGQGGAVLHIAMHACGKITLFFCAGAIFVASGKKYVSELRGIGRKMPLTMGAFMIGSLSVIGLPPLGGFISKWYLALGALDRDAMWVVVVLLISSLLNVFYLLPVAVTAFFRTSETEKDSSLKEAPWPCVVPLLLTAFGCFLLFFWSDTLLQMVGLQP
jgi:multicomponent Na+:H+ antiporter subunit D